MRRFVSVLAATVLATARSLLSLWFWKTRTRFLTATSIGLFGALGLSACVDEVTFIPRSLSTLA